MTAVEGRIPVFDLGIPPRFNRLQVAARRVLGFYENPEIRYFNNNFMNGFLGDSTDQSTSFAFMLSSFLDRGYKIASSNPQFLNGSTFGANIMSRVNRDLEPTSPILEAINRGANSRVGEACLQAGWSVLVSGVSTPYMFALPGNHDSRRRDILASIPDIDTPEAAVHAVWRKRDTRSEVWFAS